MTNHQFGFQSVGQRLIPVLVALITLPGGAIGQTPFDVRAGPPEGFDRAVAAERAQRWLSQLIALDTQNPPGHEQLAAEFFDTLFRGIGAETEIIDVGNGRANFVARLRARRPTAAPLLIMGHMDVVGADTAQWETPPFEPTIVGEHLYGRGAIDDKGPLAVTAAALAALADHQTAMTRDIIFLATAAEEGGDVGIDWIAANRPDVIEGVEFALNEGGRVRIQHGVIRTVNVQVTEKVSYNVAVRATGEGGHASVPLPDNALAALARAVSRVHGWRPPVNVNETTRLYFSRLARIEEDPDIARAMRQVAASSNERTIRSAANLLSRNPLYNAVLRTGASLTMISGGIRTNVIPSEGTANFNVRIMPGEDIREVVRDMRAVAGEPSVEFELLGEIKTDPGASPVTTPLFRAMESAARTMEPRASVIPFMSTGATDAAVLRAHGIPTYGILPLPLEMEDELRMHGDNERVPLAALGWGAEYIYRVLWTITQ